jgi:hypothetical protein
MRPDRACATNGGNALAGEIIDSYRSILTTSSEEDLLNITFFTASLAQLDLKREMTSVSIIRCRSREDS